MLTVLVFWSWVLVVLVVPRLPNFIQKPQTVPRASICFIAPSSKFLDLLPPAALPPVQERDAQHKLLIKSQSGCCQDFVLGKVYLGTSESSKPVRIRTYPHETPQKTKTVYIYKFAPPSKSVSSEQEQSYTNSHPLVEDTQTKDLPAARGANSGRFGAC